MSLALHGPRHSWECLGWRDRAKLEASGSRGYRLSLAGSIAVVALFAYPSGRDVLYCIPDTIAAPTWATLAIPILSI